MLFPLNIYQRALSNLNRNIWILAFAMFINRSGSMVMMFTSLYLTNELHYSLTQAGMVLFVYGIGGILGAFVGGWLSDKYNFRTVMIMSLLFSGFFLPVMILFTNLNAIAVIMFIYAFAADSFRPAISKGMALYSTPENRTRSVSLVRLAINLGVSVGPAIGGFIAFKMGFHPLLLIDAATSILAALIVLLYLPTLKPTKQVSTDAAEKTSPLSAYRDFDYLIFIFLVTTYGICFFQFFSSVPQYLDRVGHFDEDVIGWVLAVNGGLVALIELPLMLVLESQKKIFRLITYGAISIPIAFIILYFSQANLIFVLLYTVIITFGEIFAMPFMMNFTLSRPAKEKQGQYAALYSAAFGIALSLAPLLGLGIANKYSFEALFMVLIALSAFTALGFYLLMRRFEKEKATLV
ncbi:MAG: MFS transporter [Crocinitomicaceae bacterium]|nr:MFS transporter [Crocinitomicaceae bacterium]